MTDHTLHSNVGRGWSWVAFGVILIIAGVLAMANPLAANLTTAFMLSFALAVSGISAILAAFYSICHLD